MKKYIFDVDGTLTPSRSKIDLQFYRWFKDFATNNEVYLVTGSDREKTIEQITPKIYNLAKRVYNCSGNSVWEQDKQIRVNQLDLSDDFKQHLQSTLDASKFEPKTGNHMEERDGLLNFSIVGRNCGNIDRKKYIEWDTYTDERKNIARELDLLYGDRYDFGIAGETGIDITNKGANKSQILKDFDDTDIIYFFGDATNVGGNDHEIALGVSDRLGKNITFTVESWRHTWNILKSLE